MRFACLGRPCLQINSSIKSEILITECQVRRGKVVHRWGRNKCILYNGTIRIHKGSIFKGTIKKNEWINFSDSGEDEVIHLSKMRAELHNSRRGKCLRLTDTASIYLFLFDDDETLRLWLSRSQQVKTIHFVVLNFFERYHLSCDAVEFYEIICNAHVVYEIYTILIRKRITHKVQEFIL